MDYEQKYLESITYIREKINQLLEVMGTLPLRSEELDNDTLIALDPLGILARSFHQILLNHNKINNELSLAKDEIRLIVDSINAAIVVLDNNLNIEDFNNHANELLFTGKSKKSIYGLHAREACTCDEQTVTTLLNEPDADTTHHIFFQDKHYIVSKSKIDPINSNEEKTIILFTDITQQKLIEQNLQLYEQVFNSTTEGILITDEKLNIIEVNSAFCNLTGYKKNELVGNKPSILKSNLYDASFYKKLWLELEKKGSWKGEIIDKRKDDTLLPILQSISCIKDGDSNIQNYISISTDITALKETESRLEFLALHDTLTGLANRLKFMEALTAKINNHIDKKSHFALLYIDLDNFKDINDSLGHDVGDILLQSVSQRMLKVVTNEDLLARLGGDEFVILADTRNNKSEYSQIAQAVINELSPIFSIQNHQLHIDCSIGISLYPDDAEDEISLLKNADLAMYRAKELGRNGYINYTKNLSQLTQEKLILGHEIRHALEKNEFFLLFQPIINYDKNRIFAVESLIRWNSTTQGLITPDRFIPVAEESKLIIPIGLWVIEESIKQFKQWKTKGYDLDYISVNISSIQLYSDNFVPHLTELLKQYNFPPDCLQLEITENVMLQDITDCITIFDQLKLYGVKLSIDDFGTGYSSLSYLSRLSVDNLKIDRTFIQKIPDNKNDNMIVDAVISLAHALKLKIIAEGIENKAQINFLKEKNCFNYQGFYFSKPVRADEVFAIKDSIQS